MKRKEDFPLTKVTLLLYEGDFVRLQSLYPKIGASKVVRLLVHSHLKNIDEQASNRLRDEVEQTA